jgi:hypothetical protein
MQTLVEAQCTDFFSHWRHVLSSNFASFGFADEQSQRLIFSDNHNKGVTYTTELDFWTRHIAVQILDRLSFGPIYVTSITVAHHTSTLAYQALEHVYYSIAHEGWQFPGKTVQLQWLCQVCEL